MIAGHFGLAAGVKSRQPEVPLWALMLATVWLDVVFAALLIAGIETIETPGSYGAAVIHADYTHSLVGAALIAALFGLVAARPWGRRAGMVLGAVVFSHWLLDLVVHRGDMPILPGDAGGLPKLGFGLWRVPAAAIAVELVLVITGAVLYWREAAQVSHDAGDRRAGRAHRLGAAVLIAGLVTLALDALGI